MKNLNKLFLALLFIVATGCKDYLEEENISNLESDQYFATAEGYPKIVNASYASLRSVYSDPYMFAAGTDMYVEGRNAQPVGISEYKNLTPEDPNVEAFYRRLYSAIQTCNTALYFNDKTAQAAILPVRKGEVQFLRAYYYFLLVQNFGGVAIVTDRFTAPVPEFSRNTDQEVYAFIIKEMNEALAAVPETQSDFGRVTKRAVRHFLAKVHLTRGYINKFEKATQDRPASEKQLDFQTAANLADAAIAGQSLTTNFETLFFPGNEKNSEIIFSIQYDAGSLLNPLSDGNSQNAFFGAYMGGQGAAQGYPNRTYTLMSTMYTFDLFNQDDARFDATYMIERYARYYDYYDKAAERQNLNVAFYYAPKWANSATAIAAWRAANPTRRNNTTVIPYSAAWQAGRTTALDNAVPSVKKFDDPKSPFSQSSSTRDIFLARLGETYLIAAEAYFQLGKPDIAASRINEVRKRAAKPGKNLAITPADVTIDFILDERARELVGEYHRWLDLKRTGKLEERTRLYNRDIKRWFDANDNPFVGTNGQKKILRPIPAKALILNGASVEQNPGY